MKKPVKLKEVEHAFHGSTKETIAEEKRRNAARLERRVQANIEADENGWDRLDDGESFYQKLNEEQKERLRASLEARYIREAEAERDQEDMVESNEEAQDGEAAESLEEANPEVSHESNAQGGDLEHTDIQASDEEQEQSDLQQEVENIAVQAQVQEQEQSEQQQDVEAADILPSSEEQGQHQQASAADQSSSAMKDVQGVKRKLDDMQANDNEKRNNITEDGRGRAKKLMNLAEPSDAFKAGDLNISPSEELPVMEFLSMRLSKLRIFHGSVYLKSLERYIATLKSLDEFATPKQTHISVQAPEGLEAARKVMNRAHPHLKLALPVDLLDPQNIRQWLKFVGKLLSIVDKDPVYYNVATGFESPFRKSLDDARDLLHYLKQHHVNRYSESVFGKDVFVQIKKSDGPQTLPANDQSLLPSTERFEQLIGDITDHKNAIGVTTLYRDIREHLRAVGGVTKELDDVEVQLTRDNIPHDEKIMLQSRQFSLQIIQGVLTIVSDKAEATRKSIISKKRKSDRQNQDGDN